MKTKMIRSLLLLLTCAMLLGAFGGCGSKNPYYNQPLTTETSLDEAMATQIADDFNAYMSENDQGSNVTYRAGSCYGIFDGYVVLDFEGGPIYQPREDIVAGIVFYIGNGKDLWVWKDGEIVSLLQAYKEGKLNAEQIEAVHKARNNGNIQTDEAGNLTMDFMYHIVEDYANFQYRTATVKEDGQQISYYQVPRVFGLYNECVVVGSVHGWSLCDVVEYDAVIGNVKFHFVGSSDSRISVWKAGEFYSLREAFDQGLITNRDLRAIKKIYEG